MEIVLLKDTEINAKVFKKYSRIKVTNTIGKTLIRNKQARAYPNMIETIENKFNKIVKPKQKEE